MATLTIKKYLFRERAVRAIIEEWRKSKGLISLISISRIYDLPYSRTLNFLKRLDRDRVIKWRKVPGAIKSPSDFELTPEGERILKGELLYASSITL